MHTCGNAAAEQSHFVEGNEIGVDLDDTSGVEHSVLSESWGVEEMENRFVVWWSSKPGVAITLHDRLEWIDPKLVTYITLVWFAEDAVTTLPMEYWDHIISNFNIYHPFSHTLNYSELINTYMHHQLSRTMSNELDLKSIDKKIRTLVIWHHAFLTSPRLS